MAWVLSSVAITPHPQLQKLLRVVTMTFSAVDQNGVTVDTHTYTEPNVSNVTPAGIARLARDQAAQLELISATATGALSPSDLSGIVALMTTPALPTTVVTAIAAAVDFTTSKQSDQAIADALNTVDQKNPSPQGKVFPAMSAVALLGGLSPASRANLGANPNATAIDDAVRRGDNVAVLAWADVMLQSKVVTIAEHDAIVTSVGPIDDPTWTALVSRASLLAGRALTAADIAVCRALT